jgi:hypothetical protein
MNLCRFDDDDDDDDDYHSDVDAVESDEDHENHNVANDGCGDGEDVLLST